MSQENTEKCKVVGLVCNVALLPTALGPSFLDKGVGTGPIGTHPMASRDAIKKLWWADIIWITQKNTITTFSHNK